MNNTENRINIEKLTTDWDILTIPNTLYINFDYANDIVVKINNNEIKIDKNKLETLLKTFALTKE